MSRSDSRHHYGFSPLAGVTAGTASILLCFGVLCLAWHQVAGHVSAAVTVLVCVFVAAFTVVAGAVAVLAVLWVAHRARNPELLVRRGEVRAEVMDAEPAEITAGPAVPAIEPPRVYLNVTPDELAALMMRHDTEGGR